MKKLIISNFKNIIDFKIVFINFFKLWINNFIVDFLNSFLNDNDIVLFLKKYKNISNIKILNLEFCIHNLEFNFDDNTYNYVYSNNECFKCSYFENCKWNKNLNNKIKKIENTNVNKYKTNMLTCLCKVYTFLNKIWFNTNEVIVSGNKNILYYFLIEWYDMFFNWLSNNYFYISENNRLYVYLDNNILCNKLFMNNGENLIFKDNKFFTRLY